MASQAKLQELLDDRLARGNVSIDEYREMCVILKLPEPPSLVEEEEIEVNDEIGEEEQPVLYLADGQEHQPTEETEKSTTREPKLEKPKIKPKKVATSQDKSREAIARSIQTITNDEKLTWKEKLFIAGAIIFILVVILIAAASEY